VSNYLIRGVLASMPRGSTPERRWRLLFALVTITPDEEGWRPVGMKLLGELAGLSQPHLREARDELVRDKVVEFNCDGEGHGARHYRWRILVEELYPSGSTPGPQELNPNGQELNPNGQELNPLAPRPATTRPRASRASGASSSVRVAEIVRAAFPDAADDEIETIVKAKIAAGARSATAVIGHEIREGTLRLPCGPERSEWPGSRSEACRRTDSAGCAASVSWQCHCRCHAKPLRAAS
jgi:hypothetical protein